MSDIIEERLQKEYKFSKITVVKWHLQPRSYEILIHLDFKSGFSFVFNWKDNFTIDKNIEEIINIIDNLIVRNFKKVRT